MFNFLGRPRGAAALLSASAIALVASVSSAYAQEQQRSFNIPAQSLSSALIEFSRQSDVMVVADPSVVNGRRAPAVQGTFPPSEALSRLLTGSGLTAAQRPEGGFVLASATSPTRLGAADPAASSEEEIIVTAQKREERLLEVPVAVTAVNTDDLLTSNQLSLRDYANRVPGLTVVNTEDGGRQAVTIRGLNTGYGSAPGVAIAVDGVPYLSATYTGGGGYIPDIDPGDLARVEVLKGPQGTLYGATSLGGLVNYITARPNLEEYSGRLSVGTTAVSHGEELGYSLRGRANLPLGENLAVSLSGFTRHEPGYLDNEILGIQDVNDVQVSGGRVAALWRASDDWTVTLSALVQDQEKGGLDDSDPTLGDLQQNHPNGIVGPTAQLQAYNATIEGQLGPIGITSITGYNVQNSTVVNDASFFGAFFGGADGVRADFFADINRFTQEIRFTMPLGSRIDSMLGLFYTDENSDASYEYLSVDRASGAVTNNGYVLSGQDLVDYSEFSVFGNVRIDLTDRFDVQVGGRYSWIDVSNQSIASQSIFNSPPQFNTTTTVGDVEEASLNKFSYLISPRFRITPDFMIYGRVATGYRAGGANRRAFCEIENVPCTYDPDTATSYELGAKGELYHSALTFDAALYYIDWQDIQVLLLTPNSVGYIANGGSAASQGIELALDARPFEGMTISGWVAWNDARLTQSVPGVGLDGDRLPFSAEWSARVSVNQEFPVTDHISGFVQAAVSYVGERGGTVGSDQNQNYPSYVTADIGTGLNWADDWSLNLFVNNVTDERGVHSRTPALGTQVYIQPRTLGIQLSRAF